MIKKLFLFAALTLVAAPAAAFAGAPTPLGTPANEPQDIIRFIDTVANWFFAILLAIAVIYILLAAWEYLTSKGGEDVGKAHKMIYYAAIAIAVAVLSRGIVFVVARIAGQQIDITKF